MLMKIRTTRFNLLNGELFDQLDSPVVFPEGTAIEVIMRELNLLEQDYQSLFTGRSQTTRETYHFSYRRRQFAISLVFMGLAKRELAMVSLSRFI